MSHLTTADELCTTTGEPGTTADELCTTTGESGTTVDGG